MPQLLDFFFRINHVSGGCVEWLDEIFTRPLQISFSHRLDSAAIACFLFDALMVFWYLLRWVWSFPGDVAIGCCQGSENGCPHRESNTSRQRVIEKPPRGLGKGTQFNCLYRILVLNPLLLCYASGRVRLPSISRTRRTRLPSHFYSFICYKRAVHPPHLRLTGPSVKVT